VTIGYSAVKTFIDSIVDEIGDRKIALYPYGKGGRIARLVLYDMGFFADIIIDSALSGSVPGVCTPDVLERLDLNEYALIMVTDYYKELFYPVFQKTQEYEDFRMFNFHSKTLGSIVFSITDRCNLRCRICTNNLIKEHSDLSFDQIKRVIDNSKELNLKAISFIGLGEPLLHPDFINSIRYAVESGVPDVSVYTNGMLLDEKNIGDILSSGISRINISLTGYSPEVFAKMQGHRMDAPKLRDMIYDNVQNLIIEKKRKGVKLYCTVRTIVFEGEDEDLRDYVNHWDGKVDDIFMSYPHSIYRRNTEHLGKCDLLGNNIGIEAKGNFLLCDRACLSSEKLGRIEETAISNLLSGQIFRSLQYFNETRQIDKLPDVCQRCVRTVGFLGDEYVGSYNKMKRFDNLIKCLDYSNEMFLYGISLDLFEFITYCRIKDIRPFPRMFNRRNAGKIDTIPFEYPNEKLLKDKPIIVFSDMYEDDACYLSSLSALPVNYLDLLQSCT